MSAVEFSLIALASIFCGALLGTFFRGLLPEHHLSPESKDVMKLGTGIVATMAALVLGLLISSAKGTFDEMDTGLKQTASKIFLLDRTMALYGPETRDARDMLRSRVISTVHRVWPEEKDVMAVQKVGGGEAGLEDIERKLQQLSPKNDDQRQLRSQALQVAGEIEEARLLLIWQVGHSSLPLPFLVLLICWLAIIFFNFGLFTSRNASVIVVLFISALSLASSLFLIQELDQPYQGWIKISSAPLVSMLSLLGK